MVNTNPKLKIIDQCFWCVFLVLVAGLSFVNTTPYSFQWLFVYALIFSHAGFYCLFRSFVEIKPIDIKKTKPIFILLFLILIWQVMQLVLPVPSHFPQLIFFNTQISWLAPFQTWSVTPERTQWSILTQFLMIVLFALTLTLLNNRRRLKQLLFVFLLVGVVHAFLAIGAKYTGQFLVDKKSLDGHFNAARGLFVNRNHLAAFTVLCFFSPLTMQLYRLAKKTSASLFKEVFFSVIYLGFLLLLFLVIVLSESRGALLSLGLCLCFCFFVRKKIFFFDIGNNYFLPIMYFCFFGFILFFGQEILERLSSLSLGERTLQWQITWQAIKHQWLAGYGAGSYELVFQGFRNYADLRLVIYDQAHNDYLHIFLEQGIIGLVLWLSFIVISISRAFKYCRNTNSLLLKTTLFSVIISVSAILIQSLVGYPLQIMAIRCYFFIIIAMIFAVPQIGMKTESKNNKNKQSNYV